MLGCLSFVVRRQTTRQWSLLVKGQLAPEKTPPRCRGRVRNQAGLVARSSLSYCNILSVICHRWRNLPLVTRRSRWDPSIVRRGFLPALPRTRGRATHTWSSCGLDEPRHSSLTRPHRHRRVWVPSFWRHAAARSSTDRPDEFSTSRFVLGTRTRNPAGCPAAS